MSVLLPKAVAGLTCAVLAFVAGSAEAPWLPEEPISIAGGHVVLGAEVVATVAPDDPGFFNDTSYEYSAIRNFRLAMSAEIRANEYVQVLGELRLELPAVPAGSDTLVGWYEGEARTTRAVVVPPTGWAEVELVVP